MADIFISYSREDRAFAASLYKELGRFKVRGFMDQMDVAAGADFSRQLRDAIENADALVVVLSQAAVRSSFVLAELGMAQSLGKPVLPVLAPGEHYEDAVPPQLVDRLVIDATGVPIEEVAAKVVAAATNTSVDAAMVHVRSRAIQRQKRLALVSILLAVLALVTTVSTLLANRERNAALAATQEAEAARERIAALTGQGALALAPDGKTVALGGLDGDVRLLDIRSGRTVGELRLGARTIGSLAYSPDGKRLAVAASNEIQLWDLPSAREVASLRGHTDLVLGVQFSPDGRTLISRSLDGTVREWEPSTGRELQVFRLQK